MDTQPTLYWNIDSQPSRAVKALLDIGKIPYQEVVIDLPKLISRDPSTQSFLSINPLGQIPTLKDGDLVVTQSPAILIYLTEKYCDNIPVTFYPSNLTVRSKINQLLSWYLGTFRPSLMKIIHLKIYDKLHRKQEFSQAQIQYAQERMDTAVKELDGILARSGKYVAGKDITIADLLFYFELTNYKLYNLEWSQYKNVDEWFKLVYAIPEVKQITHTWFPASQKTKELLSSIKPQASSKL